MQFASAKTQPRLSYTESFKLKLLTANLNSSSDQFKAEIRKLISFNLEHTCCLNKCSDPNSVHATVRTISITDHKEIVNQVELLNYRRSLAN